MEYPLNIYITAHTLISSLGFGIPENLEAIHNYRSGIRMQEAGLISDHPLLAGMIDSVELEKRAKLMQITDYTRMEQLFILAIQEVISQSGADLREPDCTLLLSTTKGNIDLLSELPADSPVFLWKMAERIGDFFGATNQVEVISNACISGVSALIVAKRWIESGRYKRVIVAGGDILSHFITSGFLSFRSVSAHLCRPYDIQRDGLSLGEACGAVLLETQGNANHIILSGGAISNDANHISGPSRTGDGLALAINQAMEEAGALPEDSFICIEQLKEGIYYGTLGYETLGVPMPITVYGTHQPMPMKCCIKTASGFGGCNAALVLSLPDAHLKQKTDSPAFCKAVVESANIVTIKPGVVENQGTAIFNSSETDFAPFIREAYKHLGENNMKFYKMDNLCKLGYVAAGYLLKDTNYQPKEIGIILANASSSLDTDCKHQAIINKEGDKAASPAVFVYTLPNVVLGEICIRHKIQGENTFFVCQQSDTASLEDYARIVMAKGKLRTCIIGWCELLDGHYQAEFKQLNNISTIYG